MNKPIYKMYSIYYNGTHKEDVLATSKKNVKEYIKDNYKTFLNTINGVLYSHLYKKSSFEVKLKP